ncbi:Predicted acetyltransferase [Oceanobacillus limi]|uniref:Predicted acetyltransferase n=1 Tax=Oceanobacillus limi TaxID=930131 RepID=A0A1I0HNH7_9BACI|nr:GNAT family N-acetyltransferase [Oceanobacillus limi]SET84672.1 Predicted acetyltransferase [Oceanobacillus limi]
MIERLNVEQNAREIFELSQFAFQYQLTEDELEKKRDEARRHIIWGHMENGQIAAKLHLIPLACTINGKEFKMGGISAVATWPEHRRKGMVKDLISHALSYMKENGQVISYLHPFSVPFYRQYGWELSFNEKTYSIPIEKFNKNWQGKGYVRRISKNYQLLQAIYQDYAYRYSGTLIRDEKWWEQRILNDESTHIAVAYDEHNNPDGYILFEVKEKEFIVIEMVYRSLNGRNLLHQFIANHDSMVKKVEMVVPENDALPLLLEEPDFEQKIEPYFMARIVNVSQFLKQYPFQNTTSSNQVTLQVEDDFLPENSGKYYLRQSDLETNVSFLPSGGKPTKKIQCNIQQLTTMLLGYSRPLELFELGLITGDEACVKELENMVPIQQPYFPDYF